MFVIAEINGFQYKISKNQKLFVNRLKAKIGDTIIFNKILGKQTDNIIDIESSTLQKTFIEARVLNHIQNKKIIIFKKKRRKGYKIKHNHRQKLTEIQISSIS